MTSKAVPRHIRILLLCVGLASVLVTTVLWAENDQQYREIKLRFLDAIEAATQINTELARVNKANTEVRPGLGNMSVVVRGSPDEIAFVEQTLSRIEEKARAEAQQGSEESLLDIDPEKMTDDQLREHVGVLTRAVKEMTMRIRRLEEAQQVRIVPLN